MLSLHIREYKEVIFLIKDLPGITDPLPSPSVLPLAVSALLTINISLNICSEKMDFVLSKRYEISRGKGEFLFILYSLFKIVSSCCDQITKYE